MSLSGMEPIELTYSEELAKKSATVFWFKQLNPVIVVLAAGLVTLIVYRFIQSDSAIMLVYAMGAVMLGALALLVSYILNVRRVINYLNWTAQVPVTLEMDERGIKVKSGSEQDSLKWDRIPDLWRHDQVWLLPLSNKRFLSIPTRDLGKSGCDFILNRLAEHGVRTH